MSVYVGLDCGGSSSRVLAVDGAGNVLFQGQSGAANLVSTPESRLRRNLGNAINGCPAPEFVCGCFAGLVSDELRERGLGHLRSLFPDAAVRAEPDYTAAYYAAPPETDICVIAGTGSLVCSRASDGGMVKSGGRGFLLGDEGSAFQYGRDALLEYLSDPAAASPALRGAVGQLFGTEEESSIVPQIYRGGTPATLLAKLLRPFAADLREGRAYAAKSVERHTGSLAEIVVRHIRRHFGSQRRVVVSVAGGVWKAGPQFRDVFAMHLKEQLSTQDVQVERISRPPLYGAVELARELEQGGRALGH